MVTGTYDSQRSGGKIPEIFMAHIDPYGEIVTSD